MIEFQYESFFTGSNGIKWDDLENNSLDREWTEHIELWKSVYVNKVGFLCIPFLHSESHVTWFLGTNSKKENELFKKEIRAFVGKSPKNIGWLFENNLKGVRISDPLDTKLGKESIGIDANSIEEIIEIRSQLSIYAKVLISQPRVTKRIRKPFSQIRNEFDLAVAAGHESLARIQLEKLKKFGRLSIENHRYLEIRLAVGLKNWSSIDINLFRGVINQKPPLSIINDLSEYFFERVVREFMNSSDLTGCMNRLSEIHFKEFISLFKKRYSQPSLHTGYIQLFATFFEENPDVEYQNTLNKYLQERFSSELIKHVSKKITVEENKEENTNDLQTVNDLIDNTEYDRAIDVALSLSPSLQSVKKIYQCFKDDLPEQIKFKDKIKIKEIITHYQQVGISERENSLPPIILEAYQTLIDTISMVPSVNITIPNSWYTWLKSVKGGMSSKDSKDLLIANSKAWDIYETLNNKQEWNYFTKNLFSASGDNEENDGFNSAFTHIYECFFSSIEDFTTQLSDLAIQLLLHLALKEELPSESEKILIFDLQKKMLTSLLTKKQYSDLIDCCLDYFEKLSSYTHLDWMLDVLEEFSGNAKPENNSFQKIFNFVQGEVLRFINRLSLQQVEVFNELCLENSRDKIKINLDKGEQNQDSMNKLAYLKGKKIGIYTLEENAGNRAKRIIQNLIPTSKVKVNSDKGGTTLLKDLAKNADIFICATKASTHAATNFIEMYRSTDDIIKPTGKGSSSIINSLVEYAS